MAPEKSMVAAKSFRVELRRVGQGHATLRKGVSTSLVAVLTTLVFPIVAWIL
jgi:hypothetical protein